MFLTWFSLSSASFDIAQANGLSNTDLTGLPTTQFQFTPDELDMMAGSGGRSQSAWEALGGSKYVLLLAGLAAVATLVATLSGRSVPRVAFSAVALLGTLAAVLVLYRIVNPPDLIQPGGGGLIPAGADPSFGVTRELGVWLGLLATLGIAAGGFMTLSATRR